MKIGILKETREFENRISVSAETVKKLVASNHSIFIESGAGSESYISDEELIGSGAQINSDLSDVDLIFKVNPPNKNELEKIKDNSTITSFFQIMRLLHNIQKLHWC